MGKNKPGTGIPKVLDFFLSFLIIILYLLSKIGDGIIWIFKQPVGLIINQSWVKLLHLIGARTWQAVSKVYYPIKSFFGQLQFKTEPKPIAVIIKSKKRIRIFPRLKFSLYSFSLGIILTLIFVLVPYNFYTFLKSLPNPKLLTENHYPVTTKIFDRNGNLLYEIFSDQNRTPIKLTDVPKNFVNATIAIEDKEFYYHPGFSTKGMLRALKSVFVDKKLQGGSTITQQLIKSALLTPERTVQRKIKEILLAFWAERLYTKDQILEMYLNQVPYGGTAWGIQAAAETYFGKNVTSLTLAESALLAGLPAAPTYYSPFGTHPEYAEQRKNQVLEEMVQNGSIARKEAETAKSEQLQFTSQITNIKAPHFVMYVRELLEKKYGLRQVEQGGLRVTTSLDLSLQEKAEEIVKQQVEQLKPLNVGNGAALITNPKTGEILAMVGSKDYFNLNESGNVNIATSMQQPGSSIKVVTYSAALENGFTAASILDDSPVSYPVANQRAYAPVNYDGKFHGKVTLRKALGNSYNIPAVKTLYQIGLEKMFNYGRNMGIETWKDISYYGLSLTLGGGEVTMLDMARVYDTLANDGKRVNLNPVLKVTTYDDFVLEEANIQNSNQAIKPETAYILTSILSDNNARSDAFGPNSKLVIPGKTVAVKTGTSNDKRDNWAIGYTPSFVVTVWVGNNDNSPMNPILTSGVTGATPIWNELMTYLLKDKNDETLSIPSGIVSIPCYSSNEYFVNGTQPVGGCPTIPPPITPSPTPQV